MCALLDGRQRYCTTVVVVAVSSAHAKQISLYNRSPVLGTNYSKFDWFVPKRTAVIKGLKTVVVVVWLQDGRHRIGLQYATTTALTMLVVVPHTREKTSGSGTKLGCNTAVSSASSKAYSYISTTQQQQHYCCVMLLRGAIVNRTEYC